MLLLGGEKVAERRMFARTIIDSDAFLDMPLSTQSLYFHLSMRADDDGFINNPKKIQRMIGASEDDLKLLIAKNFIIPFENGIVVIKHWKIHNYIRVDRYKETVYQEQKEMLVEKENKAYSLLSPNGIPIDNQTVYQSETQDRLGKDRIGKVSLNKREGETPPPFQDILDSFNQTCVSYPSIIKLTESRKKHLRARWEQFGGDFSLFEKAFNILEESNFCKGKNERGWQATFDWLIGNDTNMIKVLEGNYANKEGSNGQLRRDSTKNNEPAPKWDIEHLIIRAED